jgi:hypothetical protein
LDILDNTFFILPVTNTNQSYAKRNNLPDGLIHRYFAFLSPLRGSFLALLDFLRVEGGMNENILESRRTSQHYTPTSFFSEFSEEELAYLGLLKVDFEKKVDYPSSLDLFVKYDKSSLLPPALKAPNNMRCLVENAFRCSSSGNIIANGRNGYFLEI